MVQLYLETIAPVHRRVNYGILPATFTAQKIFWMATNTLVNISGQNLVLIPNTMVQAHVYGMP